MNGQTKSITCLLCGGQATAPQGVSNSFPSPINCGKCGKYFVKGDLPPSSHDAWKKEFGDDLHLLSSWAKVKSEDGDPLTFKKDDFEDVAEQLIQNAPKTVLQKLEVLLSRLAKRSDYPGDTISLNAESDYPLAFSKHWDETRFYVQQLIGTNHITGQFHSDGARVQLSAKGWERVDQIINKQGHDSNQCFLAMWFDKSMDEYWEKGFKPAIEEAGYDTPMRIDLKEHNNKICEEIIHEIKKSKFLIADVTGSRGGVYFEAGFALALGKQVIWTCRENRFNSDVHFDTQQYNHIVWKDADDLKDRLYKRILGTIGRGKNFEKNKKDKGNEQ